MAALSNFNTQQRTVYRTIFAPETTLLAIETVTGAGLIRLLWTVQAEAERRDLDLLGLATSHPSVKLLKEAIPNSSNVFKAIERHRNGRFRGDFSSTILVVEDASRLDGGHFKQFITMACELGFAKTVVFFSQTFGFDLRADPTFSALLNTGMPVLPMTQIKRI